MCRVGTAGRGAGRGGANEERESSAVDYGELGIAGRESGAWTANLLVILVVGESMSVVRAVNESGCAMRDTCG